MSSREEGNKIREDMLSSETAHLKHLTQRAVSNVFAQLQDQGMYTYLKTFLFYWTLYDLKKSIRCVYRKVIVGRVRNILHLKLFFYYYF